jgi:hypothetical protein
MDGHPSLDQYRSSPDPTEKPSKQFASDDCRISVFGVEGSHKLCLVHSRGFVSFASCKVIFLCYEETTHLRYYIPIFRDMTSSTANIFGT